MSVVISHVIYILPVIEINVCVDCLQSCIIFFFFKQKTAYEMRISDWSSDVCSSDLQSPVAAAGDHLVGAVDAARLHLRRRLDPGAALPLDEIGRASCRERVCQYV